MDVRHTPVRGIEPRPRRWERRILATRPHGIESCNNMLWVYKGRFSNLENRHFRRRWSEIRTIPMYTMFESTIKNMLPSSVNCDLLIALCIPEKHGTPLRGIEPRPRRWKRRILATRPQGIWPLENWQLFVTNINMTHFFVMKLHCVLSNFHGIHDYVKIWCTPLRGIEPRPRRWKRRILATRPQGMVTYVLGKSTLVLVW